MKKILFLLPFVLFSCSDNTFNDIPEQPAEELDSAESSTNLTTVNLATFAGDPSRVTYPVITRADAVTPELGTLELIASIDNPSKKEGFNFTKENGEEGRYMSATSVYYNEKEDKYYVTYHMQGNNYNTTLTTEIAGAIQSFTIEDGVDGKEKVNIGTGFRAANPDELDFDFNHIYFDNTDQRILAVGHNVKNGNMDNTNAVIGVFDPEAGTYRYTTVKTSEKEYDKTTGKSLGYKDAGDVNCVIRINDVPTNQPGHEGEAYGYNAYLVATRKGLAVLHADAVNLFQPHVNKATGMNYFVSTPGSSKYVAPTNSGALFGLLYLSEADKKATSYAIESEAKIAFFNIITDNNNNGFSSMQGWNDPQNGGSKNFDTEDIENYYDQVSLPANIKPVDGKNTLKLLGGKAEERYAALGVNGMYYSNNSVGTGVKKFDSRPVNSVTVDTKDNNINGYIYVANGSKVTILNKQTLEEVVSYNAPSTEALLDDNGEPIKDEDGKVVTKKIESSANFVIVRKDNNSSVRYVTVAYGQAGVKVFKFIPPTR